MIENCKYFKQVAATNVLRFGNSFVKAQYSRVAGRAELLIGVRSDLNATFR